MLKITKKQDETLDDEEDEDGEEDDKNKVGKAKFFRASEKEREDREREERANRKRKLELANIQYVDVAAVAANKRRKVEEAAKDEEEEEKPFVPKKVTRKVERKLLPVLMKINPDDLMDSNMFQRFNKTVELIFENMEEVNMAEFDEAERSAQDGQVRDMSSLL